MSQIQIVKQPKGSKICGQCCVAMVTGKPLHEVIEIFGSKGPTTSGDVIQRLCYMGVHCSCIISMRKGGSLPEGTTCIVNIKWKGGGKHWIVYRDGVIYCPVLGEYKFDLSEEGSVARHLAYIEITPKN